MNAVQPIGALPVVAVLRDEEELTASRMRGVRLGHRDGADFVLEAVISLVLDGVGRGTTICFGDRIITVAVAKPLGSMTSCAVAVGEIAALDHEIVNHSVKNGPVVVTVLDEHFEILNMDRCVARIQLNGHRARVGTTVPAQLKFNDVGGGVGLVGHVDERQNQHARHENSNDPRWRWGAVVEQSWERRFADALILHFVEEIVV